MKNKREWEREQPKSDFRYVSREGRKEDVVQEPQTAVTSVRVSARPMRCLRETAAH